jgi:hypothetical protein
MAGVGRGASTDSALNDRSEFEPDTRERFPEALPSQARWAGMAGADSVLPALF